jgi:WD40 repeat protein
VTVERGVRSVAFSADGCKIAVAYYNRVQFFDTQTQAKIGSPRSDDTQIHCVVFSPDSKILTVETVSMVKPEAFGFTIL